MSTKSLLKFEISVLSVCARNHPAKFEGERRKILVRTSVVLWGMEECWKSNITSTDVRKGRGAIPGG